MTEAGGVFTDRLGNPLDKIDNFRKPFSYVASGNGTLHEKILAALGKKVDITYR